MRARTLVAILTALTTPPLARAETATEALKARDAEVRAALPPRGADPTPEVRARLEALVTKAIDLRGMVERAMGVQWSRATPAQRKRIVGAFERRFRQTSASQLDAYRATEVVYRAEEPGPDGVVNVPTQVVVSGEPTEITYALLHTEAGWRIQDIVIDGASSLDGIRSSFAKTIAKEGIGGLITRLEQAAEKKRGVASSAGKQPTVR
jgi:phospholipid transport system substrate-binding protein